MKAYKLYDIEQRRFFVSRDIVFRESVFHFHTIKVNSLPQDPFPDFVLPRAFDSSDTLSVQQREHIDDALANNNTTSSNSVDMMHMPTVTVNPTAFSNFDITDATDVTSVTTEAHGIHIAHRGSFGTTRPPTYLQSYHCNLLASAPMTASSTQYPLENYISYSKLSPSYHNLSFKFHHKMNPISITRLFLLSIGV